jgi:L-lactate dehydrogenase complex protein LldE
MDCHGLRELGNKKQPRELLAKVQGLELVEMSEAETCCGFGGTFAVKFPMISTAMGEVKCASALETGAEYIVSNDASCNMHIQGLADRQRQPLRAIHWRGAQYTMTQQSDSSGTRCRAAHATLRHRSLISDRA